MHDAPGPSPSSFAAHAASAANGARASSPVRDPLANRAAVLAARRRPMARRLELALSWNKLAGDLRVGLARARQDARRQP